MFVQMFTGKVTDAAQVRAVFEGGPRESGGTPGVVGLDGGVTDDGQLVALARFESEDAARANSERPEQGQWWDSLAANLDGEASFYESSEVDEDIVGDPDTAGFVQVMRGGSAIPLAPGSWPARDSGAWAGFRPDVLGSLMLGRDDGEYVMAIYFTTEAEAREARRGAPRRAGGDHAGDECPRGRRDHVLRS